MESYKSFAEVYDLFMDNVPYDDWACNIKRILREHGIEDGLVAELGCGTGQMTRRLRDAGFDMIGIMAPVDRYGDVFEDLLTCIKSIRFTDQYIQLSQRTSLPMSPQAVITENEEFITKVHLAVLQKVVG